MSLDHFPARPGDCLTTSTTPVLCLRLESARERLALPYSGLVAVRLSTDDTILTISFMTHQITIKGRRLTEIYAAVAVGSAAALAVGARKYQSSIKPANPDRVLEEPVEITISDIRIQAVEPAP